MRSEKVSWVSNFIPRKVGVTEKACLLRGARRWPSAAPGTDVTCGRCSHSQLHVECHDHWEDAGDIGSRRQDSADAGRRGRCIRDAYDMITVTITIRYVYKYGVCGATIPPPLNPFTCSCAIKNINILDTNTFGHPEIELISNRRTYHEQSGFGNVSVTVRGASGQLGRGRLPPSGPVRTPWRSILRCWR